MSTTTTATIQPDIDRFWRAEVVHVSAPHWIGRLFGMRTTRTTETYYGDGYVWWREGTLCGADKFTTMFLMASWSLQETERRLAARIKAAGEDRT